MAGQFSKSSLPKRPGAYFKFEARAPEPNVVNTLGVVALGFTHSWGPSNQVIDLGSYSEFLGAFTQGGTTPPTYTAGYKAARDCFVGEGLPGYGGAGRVLAYRMDASGVKAAHTYSNGSTGAITLTGVYTGSYGNLISATIVANSVNPSTQHDLVISVNGVEAERFTYAKTNITDLAAQVNGTTPYTSVTASKWVTAGSVTSGTALTLTTASLTGGDDGATLASGDYTAAMTAFEPYRFSVLAFANLTDSSIQSSLKTWAQNLNTKGKRFVTVVGGAASESMGTAVTRSTSFNDENFVNVGGGLYTDENYGDISTAQLAPRVAGIVAARGETQEITFARLAGVTIKTGSTEADILNAISGGVVAIARDSHPVAPTRLELGVTTYTTTSDTTKPLNIYSNLKFIRVMGAIETELTEWAEQNVIGKMQVNQATRDFIRGQMQARMSAREAAGVIQPGWSVTTDVTPTPSPTDTFVALLYQVTLGRGLQQILNTVVVG